MASTPVRRPAARWRPARLAACHPETPSARSLVLDVPGWEGHVGGQHVDIRLTAEDGYQATRSYSLSSAPDEAPTITVERVEDGEVSPYLVEDARPGDRLEVRGPIGGYFVWHDGCGEDPLLLIAGGSGIAPMRAIWRAAARREVPTRLVYVARTRERVIFRGELTSDSTPMVSIHLTREQVPGFEHGRPNPGTLAALVEPESRVYVCGPTGFVEDVAAGLSKTGLAAGHLRIERFG